MNTPMSSSAGRRHLLLRILALVTLAFMGTACSDSGGGSSPPGDDGNNGVNNDTNNDQNNDQNNDGNNDSPDAGDRDADDGENDGDDGPDADDPPTAEFGDPCQSNTDCVSGYCSTSPLGFVCTDTCAQDEDCPDLNGDPMRCRLTENFGPDGVRICTPATNSLCSPCFRDDQCFGGACVGLEGGSVCGIDCENDGNCPDGSTCQNISPLGEILDTPQCLPTNRSCDCTADNAGETRPCVREEENIGLCFGQETCDPARGWFGCDAPLPTPEQCDGIDNNCNGAIDDGLEGAEACERTNEFGTCTGVSLCEGEEGFVCQAPEPAAESCDLVDNDCDGDTDEDFKNDNGLYVSVEHCGVCNNNCDGRFDLAAATDCRVLDGVAQCVITECIRGFALAGPTTCLPLASDLCSPCQDDNDCNADVGDRCIDYGGTSFCGRDCSDDSPFGNECPSGYTCDEQSNQCRLTTGTCLCGPNDNFIRPCSIPDPNDENNNCVGTITCSNGELSACVPPVDECNGIDDDCNGIIDDGLRDPDSGRYFTDEHCGRCFNNCALLFSDPNLNGDGVCNGQEAILRDEIPECILDCDVGFRNVNGITADGCECEIQTINEDDPDPNGTDADCDGIDGRIVRGVFVSRTGNDNNPGTIDEPLRNIQTAIERAGGFTNQVYVSAGVYEESLTLRPGISIFGGYSSDFRQRDLAGNETAIFGQAPTPEQPGAINAVNISGEQTTVAGFTVVGYDNNTPSGSTYVFHVTNSDGSLIIRNNVIRAGAGGDGLPGGPGNPGTAAIDNAQPGAPQLEAGTTICINNGLNQSSGGSGGVNSCTDQFNNNIDASGGDGGNADCPIFNEPEETGANGEENPRGGNGGAGGYNQLLVTNQFGVCALCLIPDEPGSTEVGVPGVDGSNGDGGTPGTGCRTTTGRVVEGRWVAGPRNLNPNAPNEPNNGTGGTGLKGLPGGGGGGGGAGSGVQRQANYPTNCAFREVIGGGGGGGGAGGCGGTGGTGGTPGGGSFAVFLYFPIPPASLPQVRDNTIERGRGGFGGDGGAGAEGGGGAPGKEAQALNEAQQTGLLVCSDPGGRGGDGGNGGAGGGGGGGCGGLSAGVYLFGHGNLDTSGYNNNTYPDTGAGGGGGRGGVSIGNIGIDGSDGLYLEVAE